MSTHPPRLNRISVHSIDSSVHSFADVDIPPVTLPDAIASLPCDASWALPHVTDTFDANEVAAVILTNESVAVTDASLKINRGTAAFVIENERSNVRVEGVHKVPGPIAPGDSLRCELSGIYGIVCLIGCIHAVTPLTGAHLTVACDNIAAIRVLNDDYLPDPSHKSYDLLQAIWHSKRLIPIVWKGIHVKGHLDDHHRWSDLSRVEQLNVQMDFMAKDFWAHTYTPSLTDGIETVPPPLSHAIHNEGWTIWEKSSGNKIIQADRNSLYSILSKPSLLSYWTHSHQDDQLPRRLHPDTISLIDWPLVQKHMVQLSIADRRFTTKHASSQCGVGTTLVLWKKQDDDHCPCCGNSETSEHVIQCPDPRSTQCFNKSIQSLRHVLNELQTDPAIRDALIHNIEAWRDGSPPPYNPSRSIQEVVEAQTSIGWQHLFTGLPAMGWVSLQDQFYRRISDGKRCRSGTTWMLALLKQLTRVHRALWKHRNEIKHKSDRPRHAAMRKEAEAEVTLEHNRGFSELPSSYRAKFRISLDTLLRKPDSYLLAWLESITQGREFILRQRTQDETATEISPARARVLEWKATGRAR